jgi:predicted phage gp36 major capsid-like protein
MDAACMSLDRRGYISDQVAATIRAAADQVTPDGGVFVSTVTAAQIRRKLLAIATELDTAAND